MAVRSSTRAEPASTTRLRRSPPVPDLPAIVRAPTALLWRSLSALRGKRIFHPRGAAYDAVVEIPGGADTGVPLFDEGATYAAIARLSRGAGLPRPLPDILGVALRILDAHGRGRHQDLLMNTSIDAPVLHHLMVPAIAGTYGHAYSSVLPYRIGGDLRLVGVLPGREGVFHLSLAPPLGRFTMEVGTVRLGRPLPQPRADALTFNPWHTGGGIVPAGPLQGLRGAAYPGSQQGRQGR